MHLSDGKLCGFPCYLRRSCLRKVLPSKTRVSLNPLVGDGGEIKENHDIAKEFNKFFSSVGAKPAAKFWSLNAPPVAATRCCEHFSFYVVEAEQMFKLLSGLHVNKEHGLDNVPARALRVRAAELAFLLATIFSYSLMTDTLPSDVEISQSDS